MKDEEIRRELEQKRVELLEMQHPCAQRGVSGGVSSLCTRRHSASFQSYCGRRRLAIVKIRFARLDACTVSDSTGTVIA